MKINKILKYKNFKNYKTRITSGIVFIFKNKILLVHPPNHKWNNSFSYPKGRVDKKETIKQAAIRETEEEVGIKIPDNLLKKSNLYRMVNRDEEFGGIIKIDYYYVVNLNNEQFKKIFKNDIVINNKKLQKKEVDWAGFINKKNSQNKIKPRLKKVLNHL